jgi:hypothetical protein
MGVLGKINAFFAEKKSTKDPTCCQLQFVLCGIAERLALHLQQLLHDSQSDASGADRRRPGDSAAHLAHDATTTQTDIKKFGWS